MVATIKVVGVHRILAEEPCHIVELLVAGEEEIDFSEITQRSDGQPRENWQVAFGERRLPDSDGGRRYVVFFHYLDLARPLGTPYGLVDLPDETPIPAHMNFVGYERP